MYISTYFAYAVSFIPIIPTYQVILDAFIDFCFFIDIILSFFTVTQNKIGLYTTSHYKIVMNYLKSWFFIDLLTIIPWEFMLGDNNKITKL